MILGNPRAPQVISGGRATLDDVFRRAVAQRPDAVALADPANRKAFTDGAPLRLTYGEVDHFVSAIAARLRRLDLAVDSVVALQLPNTVEAVITLLGVLRAGMIPALLPILWRRSDAINALNRVDAKVIITTSRVGAIDYGHIAMHVAAEIFPVRFVCGFGTGLADGIIPLDDVFSDHKADPLPPVRREANPAAHVALITWETTPEGLVPIARNHIELIAGGLAMLLEGQLQQQAVILGACAMSSFGGLALTVLPWLLTGGTLSLHQPFDPAVLATQCRHDRCDTMVVPGPLVSRLAEAGVLSSDSLRTVLGFWRSPERLPVSPPWQHPKAGLVDVLVFGETALFGARRGANGRAAAIPFGPVVAPRGAAGAVGVAELLRTETGTVALRGPMVPRYPFPPGAERGTAPYFRVDPSGLVDTGYTCRVDRDSRSMVVTGPPPGIVSVGGYRFLLSELQDLVGRADAGAALAALPDALAGHRLAGNATDRAAVRKALVAIGVNPLVADAFRERRGTPEAA